MFTGSLVAIVTPMKSGTGADTPLDLAGLERLLEYHIDNKSDGIVAVGTTGESATLMPAEHCEVIKRIVEIVNKRIPVIAGTGANSTIEAIELTAYAKEAGADASLLVTPYYNKPTQAGLYEHFKAIAASVSIPQILYTSPDVRPAICCLKPYPDSHGSIISSGSRKRREIWRASIRSGKIVLMIFCC